MLFVKTKLRKVIDMSRKDSWLPEDDHILAETVLEYVRNGKTQGEAFKAASEKLTRTAAACGFRWNSEVRKHYEDELKQAKQEKKSRRSESNQTPIQSFTATSTATVNTDQDPFEALNKALDTAREAYRKLQRDYDKLRRENAKLEKKLAENNSPNIAAVMQLMDKMKELGFTNKESSAS
jgi:prespore-specific regulator